MKGKCIRPSDCTAEGCIGPWCEGCQWHEEEE